MRRDSPPARSARALLGALTLAGLAAIVVHPGVAVASSSSARPAATPAGDRKDATATLLADGTVLASGGTGQAQPAEVYDPAKGSWTATGPMMQPRVGHAATALDDGRVLVTGGVVDAVATATAEIYDPAARTWAATAPMAAVRSFHTATLLRDGRVLVAGGQAAGHGPFVSEAEVFDPAAGSWSSAGALEQGRSFHAAARLADGRVLVTGGQGDPHGTSLRDASVYDPPSNTWSVVPELMAVGRSNHTMTVLGNGMVLIAGGTPQRQGDNDGDQIQASAELFDPTSWSFVPAAPMATARASQAAVALADGRALVVGGQSARGGVLIPATTAEVYDPSADRWEPAGTVARAADSWRTTAVLMKDDVLVLDGGAQLLSVPVSGSNSADIARGAGGSSNARAAVIAVGLAVAVFIGVLSAFRYGAGRRQAGGW